MPLRHSLQHNLLPIQVPLHLLCLRLLLPLVLVRNRLVKVCPPRLDHLPRVIQLQPLKAQLQLAPLELGLVLAIVQKL